MSVRTRNATDSEDVAGLGLAQIGPAPIHAFEGESV